MKIKKKKEKTLANGRVVITDFRKLSPDGFVTDVRTAAELREVSLLLSVDGKVYLDQDDAMSDIVADIFAVLMVAPRGELKMYKNMMQKRFWWVKTLDDWAEMRGSDEDRIRALSMLFIPTEEKRREIEMIYYGNAI